MPRASMIWHGLKGGVSPTAPAAGSSALRALIQVSANNPVMTLSMEENQTLQSDVMCRA
jgi:hypothetical protein